MNMKYNVISASCKGRSNGHIYQDHLRVYESETCLLAVVADGLGSVVSSSRGSELICQIIAEFASNIDWRIHDIPEMLNTLVSEWYRRLEVKGVSARDCCTTCSAIIVNKPRCIVYLCQIGDSPIFYRIDEEEVNILSSEKEFLNETECIGTSLRPSFSVIEKKFSKRMEFLIATDGFGDEVVHEVAGSLFDYFKIKYSKIREKKRNSALKIELMETMQNKNNDDKSIIFGWTCQ